MKFILHNLRMIGSRLHSNGWALAELFLVFIVMWFLCDSLGCLKYTFYRPLGYNIDHVYRLNTIISGPTSDTTLTNADRYLRALQKLEQEPSVEAAALCYWSLPMSGNNSNNSLAAQDTIWVNGRIINTTGGYIDVFRMSDDPKRPFAKMPAGWNNVMLSQATVDRFKKRMPAFSLDTPLSKPGDTTSVVVQAGMVGAFRTYRYGSDAGWYFYRLDENLLKTQFADEWAEIVFRVKPAADGPDYRAKFVREIAPRLDVDDLFVADAVPYTEQQLEFEVMNGDTDKVNSQAIVVLFLLVNVFLGLIGTFWFRTRRRRSEIALRLAMGSTKNQVFRLLAGEGLLLLALVTIPAMIICYNIGIAEFTIGRTELISTWPVEWSFVRFLLGSLGAWFLIALMVMVGIWFPARQAMKIQPAEALHEE
ncbi:FtsX-like permease family protein [Bacteroides timonensis]|uniref:FtsX-like permease family protein n=1 Tax=Bacteroides timonensis TaxID=1470345 RepID=UPI0005C6E7C3|nr:FtsX-like permease family protein [Bacteroides timonensis]